MRPGRKGGGRSGPQKAEAGPRGCGLRGRGTWPAPVSPCPSGAFRGPGTSSHPGGKASGSGGACPSPPPGLPAPPDSGSARGSTLQPSPSASLTGPGSRAAPGPRATGLGRGGHRSCWAEGVSWALTGGAPDPGGAVCSGEAVRVPATAAQSRIPASLQRKPQDPRPAGALPCSQPGTSAPSPDRSGPDSVPKPPGRGPGLGPGWGEGRAVTQPLWLNSEPPAPRHTPRGRACVWGRKHPRAFRLFASLCTPARGASPLRAAGPGEGRCPGSGGGRGVWGHHGQTCPITLTGDWHAVRGRSLRPQGWVRRPPNRGPPVGPHGGGSFTERGDVKAAGF